MKLSWGLLVVVIFAIVLNSCFEAPTYPTTPEIEFKSIQFIDVPDTPTATPPDSLILTIKFKDGDGDLGLDTQGEDEIRYADHFYFKVNDNRKYVTTNPDALLNDPNIIRYKTKRTNHNYDTLPPYAPPYNCINWEILKKPSAIDPKLLVPADTIYFVINPNNKNIFVDFLVKQTDGTFVEFDWLKQYCSTFDGRFPVLSKDLNKSSPLEGEIVYNMTSVGFLVTFSTKTLKLRVTIQDRALNKSNTIETSEFRLK